MAATGSNVQRAYAADRFIDEIREEVLCSICHEVPGDARLCENHDHIFCFGHITRHLLENSETCPVCRDPLTSETLRRPTGFLKNYLDDLKIKCDHHDWGCPEVVRLEDLQRHVDQCEFAPVKCENIGCGQLVDKRDKENHEQNLCKFRIAKCHDCRKIIASQEEIRKRVDEVKLELNEMNQKIVGSERVQDEIKTQMTVDSNEVIGKITGIERKQEHMQTQMNAESNEMMGIMTGIERKQDQIQQSVDGMRREIEEMVNRFDQVFRRRYPNSSGPHPSHSEDPTKSPDIIILGGFCPPEGKSSVTIEKYDTKNGISTDHDLPHLNCPRARFASCVYNGDVIAAGGYGDNDGHDTIEILKMNQEPLRWTMFDGKIPVKISNHVVTVYRDKLYVIGGYNWSEGKTTDAIYELSLVPPFTAKLATRMPQPRRNHRAEIVNGKLFILGGTATSHGKDSIDSVVVYDLIMNEIKQCPFLPKPLCRMSTVAWGDKIIIIGGLDKNEQDLKDVIMYDTETGGSQNLPPMIHKRSRHCAVIMDDVIFVLGGWNNDDYLNSVETFTIGGDGWQELPGMTEKRKHASAVVEPQN